MSKKYMTEAEKKAETARLAAEAKAKEKEDADASFEDEIADLSEEEQEAKRAERDASNHDNEPDYEAQLEAERARRVSAETALAEKRFKAAERRRKADDDDEEPEDDEDDDTPITKKDLPGILATTRQEAIREVQAERIQEIALDLAENDAHAKLIVEIHKNRTWPSSIPLKEQLEEAAAIANRKKLVSKNKELTRALGSKGTVSRDAAGSHRDPAPSTAPKMDSKDVASYKRAGFAFDATTKLWKKKLPTGKFLIKDPVSKRTYQAP